MNRAWLLRAEQRIERLERKIQEQNEQIEALRSAVAALAEKRGPGRPPKAAE